jgi:hypothetical protein
MRKIKTPRRAILLAAIASLLPFAARADLPGKHPHYLHALSDLRAASWLLEHRPGDAAVRQHEDAALAHIAAAYGEIKKAAIDDGKNIHDHPSIDVPNDYRGRLHQAAALLKKARSDVDREEDDPRAKGLKHRAIEHVEAALRATDHAIADVEGHR